MKKAITIGALLLITTVIHGQTVYPLNLKIAWDLNPETDNIQSYTVKLDTKIVGGYSLSAICNSIGCIAPLVVPDNLSHVACVSATNEFGTSEDSCITFRASTPGKVINIKITK